MSKTPLNILALDASTEYLSLAILKQPQTSPHDGVESVFALDEHAGQSHSQVILPKVAALLAESGLTMSMLDGIAFGAGPGSFTGLRISCGVAQGLAFGANLPVVGIGTLLALAEQSGEQKVYACLDARMGEVYFAAYEKQAGAWVEIIAPGLAKPEQLPTLSGEGWVGVGSGWDAYHEALLAVLGAQVQRWLPSHSPSATAMARLAMPILVTGKGVPAAQAAPVYIRNKVAFTIQERATMAMKA